MLEPRGSEDDRTGLLTDRVTDNPKRSDLDRSAGIPALEYLRRLRAPTTRRFDVRKEVLTFTRGESKGGAVGMQRWLDVGSGTRHGESAHSEPPVAVTTLGGCSEPWFGRASGVCAATSEMGLHKRAGVADWMGVGVAVQD